MTTTSAAPDIRDWITLAIALAAALIGLAGPLVQWFVAKRQLEQQRRTLSEQFSEQRDALNLQVSTQRELTDKQVYASVRSSSRQAWINSLRDDVSTYLYGIHNIALIRERGEAPTPEEQYNVGKTYTSIELKLNPNEEAHKELLKRLETVATLTTYSPDHFAIARNAVVKQAQEIFKFEWNRVKRGE